MLKKIGRTARVLSADFTRSQAGHIEIIAKHEIEGLFKPKVHQIFQRNSPTPQKTIKDILLYSSSKDRSLYQTLSDILGQMDNSQTPFTSLKRADIETIYKELPMLDDVCRKLEKEQKIQAKWGVQSKASYFQQHIANIRSLQQNLDIFTQEILFPQPKTPTSGTTLPHLRKHIS